MTQEKKKRATATSWGDLPAFVESKTLGLQASYSLAELELLRDGLIPEDMDEKWFV